jgi:hypothetical protein
MRLSYTNVKTFRDCPKKYQFKYIQHLPEPEGEELQIGIVGHKVLEGYYSNDPIARSQMVLESLLDGIEKVEPAIRQKVKESLEGYHEWAEVQDKGIKIVQAEREINIQVGDYLFNGKIDAVAELNGQPILLEHKFKGQWGPDVAEQFQFDEQNKGYSLATGCRQVLYNLIRTKPAKTRPRFERVHILVPESETTRFADDLGLWGNKIEEAKRNNQFPRNRGYGCRFCPFVAPCYGLSVKEVTND